MKGLLLTLNSSVEAGWLIDHAPLFPPALLSPEDAIAAHASGAASPRSEWLNSIVWPFSRMNELDISSDGPNHWVQVALLVTANNIEHSDQVRELAVELGPRLKHIESAALPDAALLSLAADTPIFVEVPTAGASTEEIANALDTLQHADSARPLRAKVRCGGSPAQVPTSAQLATFIRECATREIPWKATAGLHHGTPLFETEHPRHGLVNVIAAAAAGTEGASVPELQRLLEEPNPPPLSKSTLDTAAKSFMSLGSCSFDEPLEALEANQNTENRELHQ